MFLSHPALRRDMERYENLLCGTAPGVHEAIARTLVRHVPHRAGVIDIGAGTGALLLRLRNAGFDGLHAADLARENFALGDVPHTCVDLNSDFAAAIKDRFDVVVASEVIEHLDSPRHALRQIREIMRPGGYLLLTVPNVGFWEGRLKFLLKGELWGFSEESYRSIRHISPMPGRTARPDVARDRLRAGRLYHRRELRHPIAVGPARAPLGSPPRHRRAPYSRRVHADSRPALRSGRGPQDARGVPRRVEVVTREDEVVADTYVELAGEGRVPIKAWVRGVALDEGARRQLENTARLPFVFKWIAREGMTPLALG